MLGGDLEIDSGGEFRTKIGITFFQPIQSCRGLVPNTSLLTPVLRGVSITTGLDPWTNGGHHWVPRNFPHFKLKISWACHSAPLQRMGGKLYVLHVPPMGVSNHVIKLPGYPHYGGFPEFWKKTARGEIGFYPYRASGHLKIHNTPDILSHFTQANTHSYKIRPWEQRPQWQLTSHQPLGKRSRKTTKPKIGQLGTHKLVVLENGGT
jgi:hypothetical protein